MAGSRLLWLCAYVAVLIICGTDAISFEDADTYPFDWADVGDSSSSSVPLGCECKEPGVSDRKCKKFECPCVCNVMAGKCDYGCCCDPECTSDEVHLFEDMDVCANEGPADSNIVFCYSDEELVKINPHYPMNAKSTAEQSVDGLLCVSKRNSAYLGRFYVEPSSVNSREGAFEEVYSNDYPLFGSIDESSSYLQNQSLLAAEPGVWMAIPDSDFSGYCNDNNFAEFANNIFQRRCVRKFEVDTFADACNYLATVDSYKQSIFATPSSSTTYDTSFTKMMFESFSNGSRTDITEGFFANSCSTVYDANGTLADPASCAFSDGFGVVLCRNVVKEVTYIINTTDAKAVSGVSAAIVVTDVPMSNSSTASDADAVAFQQSFLVEFAPSEGVVESAPKGNEVPLRRSGNPGYLIGYPVLAGELTSTTVDGDTKSAIAAYVNGLQAPGTPASGICDSTTAMQVLFGYDTRAGCITALIEEELQFACADAAAGILPAYFSGYNGLYVGSFGNADPTDTSQWLQVDVESTPTTSTTWDATRRACTDMIASLNYKFYITNVGRVGNPQRKIKRATVEFGRQDWVYTRRDGNAQKFELAVTISFLDADDEDITKYNPPAPPILFRLPSDAFYPFN